jgi:hypothetical protein
MYAEQNRSNRTNTYAIIKRAVKERAGRSAKEEHAMVSLALASRRVFYITVLQTELGSALVHNQD